MTRKRPGRSAGRQAEVFSLWLQLQGEPRRRLRRLIARLARRCGTVPFDPHVTLLGGISLPRSLSIAKTVALARGLRPFQVRLLGKGHEPAFFRCLYLRAAGAGLRTARGLAARSLAPRVPAGRPFRPHLSLIYGRLPAADRRRLTMELGSSRPVTFTAREIALVRTSGDPRTWRIVAVHRLGK